MPRKYAIGGRRNARRRRRWSRTMAGAPRPDRPRRPARARRAGGAGDRDPAARCGRRPAGAARVRPRGGVPRVAARHRHARSRGPLAGGQPGLVRHPRPARAPSCWGATSTISPTPTTSRSAWRCSRRSRAARARCRPRSATWPPTGASSTWPSRSPPAATSTATSSATSPTSATRPPASAPSRSWPSRPACSATCSRTSTSPRSTWTRTARSPTATRSSAAWSAGRPRSCSAATGSRSACRPDNGEARALHGEGIATGRIERHHEGHIRTRSGERRTMRWSHTLVTNPSGRPVGTTSLGEDITEKMAAQRALAHRATHDPLTGLANRTLLDERLDHRRSPTPTRPGGRDRVRPGRLQARERPPRPRRGRRGAAGGLGPPARRLPGAGPGLPAGRGRVRDRDHG